MQHQQGGRYDETQNEILSQPKRFHLGKYHGLSFGIELDSSDRREVFLEGAALKYASLSSHGPRAVLNALDRIAGGYQTECEQARDAMALAQGQLRDYEVRMGKPFAHDAYLAELTTLRDQLKAGLADPASNGQQQVAQSPEAGSPPLPSVAVLAERIKTLTASHTIEAAPRHGGHRRTSTAEEPVTARVRRRIRSDIPAQPPAETEDRTDEAPPLKPAAQEITPALEEAHSSDATDPRAERIAAHLERRVRDFREQVGKRRKESQLALF